MLARGVEDVLGAPAVWLASVASISLCLCEVGASICLPLAGCGGGTTTEWDSGAHAQREILDLLSNHSWDVGGISKHEIGHQYFSFGTQCIIIDCRCQLVVD
ncbi:hypothetical protein HAX54_021234, partial [Datura stramonium]|nr:hypothetical protein [Datura stramonium]